MILPETQRPTLLPPKTISHEGQVTATKNKWLGRCSVLTTLVWNIPLGSRRGIWEHQCLQPTNAARRLSKN